VVTTRDVCVIGLGYVGLPLACAAAEAGHRVTGYDPDRVRVSGLSQGRSPVEDVEDRWLEKVMATGRLSFTDDPADIEGSDTFVICVPTPLKEKSPDLTMVDSAVDVVAKALRPAGMVILESTTYPGTTEDRVAPRLAEATGLRAPEDYHLVFSPERIDPGNPVYSLQNTPRVVGGLGPAAGDAATSFYSSFIDKVHRVSGPREAEMAKLLENTYRHVNIALVNEMAVFCNELGIDLWDAINEVVIMPVFDKEANAITRLAAERGRVAMVRLAFETAREANPAAKLVLNDFDLGPDYERLIEECRRLLEVAASSEPVAWAS